MIKKGKNGWNIMDWTGKKVVSRHKHRYEAVDKLITKELAKMDKAKEKNKSDS